MAKSDGFLNSRKHQRTKILPLRWIGNLLSYVATRSLVKAINLDEENNLGFRFKFHSKVWHYLNKPYQWWGTYYTINLKEPKKDSNE